MDEDWINALMRKSSPAWLFSELSGLRDGGLASAGRISEILSLFCLELHSRAIVGSAKVFWVVDVGRKFYLKEGFLSTLDSELRCVNAIQASLNDWLKAGGTRRALVFSFLKSCYDIFWESPREEPSEASSPSYAVVVSAVVLLSLVYQYLTGNVDRGGSKAYSRSSLDFRDIYVAIVLFLGAYVWIKFREVAPKGVYSRKRGTKVVYEPRFKPPRENGRIFHWLYLGQYGTSEEASILYQIAAFYYNENHGGLLDLGDGRRFSIPPTSEGERSLTGAEKRAWVKVQAMKIYEDFKKKKAEAALMPHELLEAWEVQVTPEQDEVAVEYFMASLLTSPEHQPPALVSQVENSGMGMAMPDNHGLECASHSFDGMHEVLALSNGHGLGSQEGSALPVSPLPPNTESGMSLDGSDQLDLLQTRVGTQQQQISLQQQQISDQQRQISLQQQQIQEFAAQILQLQHQQRIQQQQLQEFRIQNPQWPYQFCLQQQQLQDINQGVSGFEVEMEQSLHQQNYAGHMAPPPDGGEAQEAF